MKVEHISDNIICLSTAIFETKVDGLYRYYTLLEYHNETFTVTDRWTGQEYYKGHFNSEDEVYAEVERLALLQKNHTLKRDIIEFNNKPKPTFSDELKDKLFDAWLYNTDIYHQVTKMEDQPRISFEQEKQSCEIFNDVLKYYYERSTNTIVLLDKSEVIMHNHFWIQVDCDESVVENLLTHCFGKEIKKEIELYYFKRRLYNELLKKLEDYNSPPDKLVKFQRLMSENWLRYINKHFIIPVSFSNRYDYE